MKKIITIAIIIMTLLVVGCTYEEEPNKKKLTDNNLGSLLYQVPKSFKKSSDSTDNTYFYHYINKNKTDSCTLTILIHEPYTTDLEKIIKTYMYSDEDFVNNIKWKYAENKRGTNTIYYVYTTIHDNKNYVIQYDDLRYGNYCNYAYKKIIKSLKFKE